MLEIIVSDQILKVFPRLQLGCLQCHVKISAINDLLWSEIIKRILSIKRDIHLDEINKLPVILKTREAYKSLGKDPSRYRPSAEALLRRIVLGKDLYQLNSAVDTINLLSLESGYSIGGYDSEKISGTITLKKGAKNDIFQAIGRGDLNIDNLPVLYDEIGAIGSPTSDSTRTCITLDTRQILIVFFDFDRNEMLQDWIDRAANLLADYSEATNTVKSILKFTNSA